MNFRVGAFAVENTLSQQKSNFDNSEDQEVWALLYNRQVEALSGQGHPDVFLGLERFGLTETLPDLARLSQRLFDQVGWRLREVSDQISPRAFVECLRDHALPTTGHVRGRDELVHSRRPDMFHDLFGHIPLLIDADYRAFLAEYAEHALSLDPDAEVAQRLATAFKWMIEYGLMVCGGGLRACGAGLLSSSKELAHALGPDTRRFSSIPPSSLIRRTHRHAPAALLRAASILAPTRRNARHRQRVGCRLGRSMNEALEGLRLEIDALDNAIVRALARRMAVCRAVAEVKQRGDLPVMQPNRLSIVRERAVALGTRYGLSGDYVNKLFANMVAETCRVEEFVMAEMAETSGLPPIFIGGEDRSGTTLVSLILDSHPAFTVGPEFSFTEPPNLGPYLLECCRLLLEDDPRTQGDGVAAADPSLAAGVQFARQALRHGISHEVLMRLVADTMQWTGGDLVEYKARLRLLGAIGYERRRLTGCPGWGMKIQREIMQCTKFLAVWPDARFLHVVRDGRDVAVSHLIGQRGWGPKTVESAATQWSSLVGGAAQVVPAERLFVLRYEDLVANPEPMIRALLTFLELEWDDSVLRHAELEHSLLSEPVCHPSAEAAARPIYADAVGRFRREFTLSDIATFERIAEAELRRYGYIEPTSLGSSLSTTTIRSPTTSHIWWRALPGRCRGW